MNGVLRDPVFGFYLKVVFGVIGVAGAILATIDLLLRRNIRSIWLTYRGWLIMASLYLGCLALGRAVLVSLLVAVSVFALKEYCRVTGLSRDPAMAAVTYVGVLAVGAICLVSETGLVSSSGGFDLFNALPIYMIALIVLVPISKNRVEGQLQSIALALVGFLYVGWMFGHLALLTTTKYGLGYVLYLAFSVALNDVAAFVFGRLFGKHALRSSISPRKTWEGAVGALGFSLLLPWLLRPSFPQFGAVQLTLTGLIVGVGGQLGDLSISLIKRDMGVKDMGSAIPGHGGVLDRIDSMMYVAPLFFHMTRYFDGK